MTYEPKTYAEQLESWGDEEFCWNCAAVLDHWESISVNRPESYPSRECCSERCASRAVLKNAVPEMTPAQARLANPVDYETEG